MSAEPVIRPDAPMCVAVVTYVAPLDEVDAQLSAHVDWLERAYEQGIAVMSGRRSPRTGGVILFRGEKASVEAVVASDPFVTSGVATTEVIAFTASMAHPGARTMFE